MLYQTSESGGVRSAAKLPKLHATWSGIVFFFFFVPFRTRKNPAASKSHPRKKTYLHNGNSLHAPASWTHTKRDTSDIMQPTEHPRTSPPGSRESEHMPLYPFCLCLQESEISQAIAAGVLQA